MRNEGNVQCYLLKDQYKFSEKFIPKKVYRFLQILFILKKLKLKNSSILIGTNPFLLPLLVPILKLLGSKYIVLLCFDFFPINVLNQSKAFYLYPILRTLYHLFKFCYRSCDRVVASGRDIQNLIIKLKFNRANATVYIPNWAFVNNQQSVVKNTLSITEPRFLFFGNMGRFQAIPQILNQIAHVSNRKAKFIFAGSGKHSEAVIKAAESDSRIEYLGSVALENKDEIFSYANISIVSLVPKLKGCCVPSKVYFSLAAGHPILCFVEAESEVDLLCKEFKCGWNLDILDDFALNAFIKNLSENDFVTVCEGVNSFPEEVLFGKSSLQKIKEILLCSDK